MPLGAVHLLHPLDDVHRHADRARLVGERAGDRLADPPGRVRRELVAAAPVELLDGADQAERAFLDQVEERQALVAVVLRDRDDEAQVRLDHPLLRVAVAAPRSAWRARPPAAAVSSGWRPASRRKSCSASVVVSQVTGAAAAGSGYRSAAASSSSMSRSIAARLELAVDARRARAHRGQRLAARRSARTAARCRAPRPRRPAAAGRRSSRRMSVSVATQGPSSRTQACPKPPRFADFRACTRVDVMSSYEVRRPAAAAEIASMTVPPLARRSPDRRQRFRRSPNGSTTARARRSARSHRCTAHLARRRSLVRARRHARVHPWRRASRGACRRGRARAARRSRTPSGTRRLLRPAT